MVLTDIYKNEDDNPMLKKKDKMIARKSLEIRTKHISSTYSINSRIGEFRVIEKLGEGKFAEVLLAQRKNDNRKYAIKIVPKIPKNSSFEGSSKRLITEKEIMKRVRSPYIPKLYASFQDNNECYLVMEYYPSGSLESLKNKNPNMNELDYKPLFAQIVLAIEDLHKANAAHCDIKPCNILLAKNGQIGLTDFGLSQRMELEEGKDRVKGSPVYMAPEVLNRKITMDADWWSFGVMLYYCLTDNFPFNLDKAFKKQVGKNGQKKRNFNHKISLEILRNSKVSYPSMSVQCEDLLKGLLVFDGKQRLGHGVEGVKAIKQHPFFEGIDWNTPYSENKTLKMNIGKQWLILY